MNDSPEYYKEKPPVGNLVDFVDGISKENPFDIEIAITESGRVIVFQSHGFTKDLAWFEFDLNTNQLDFIMEDGAIRDIGLPLTKNVSKYMQNAHQIMTVLMDPETGEASDGNYVPLIIHST